MVKFRVGLADILGMCEQEKRDGVADERGVEWVPCSRVWVNVQRKEDARFWGLWHAASVGGQYLLGKVGWLHLSFQPL